jgi:quinol-cytochrome oxidoreductase complex cytochrome b subunit
MILVLRPGASAAEVAEVLQELERRGCTGSVMRTGTGPVVHVTGGRSRRARRLRELEQVVEILPTSGPRVRREGWRFFPYHFVNWSAFGVALLGLLVFLAGMLPTGIGDEVDYSHPPEVVAQPWYLCVPLAFVHAFPPALAWLGWILLALAALALFFLPLLDRTPPESSSSSRLRQASALALVAAVAWTLWKGVGA